VVITPSPLSPPLLPFLTISCNREIVSDGMSVEKQCWMSFSSAISKYEKLIMLKLQQIIISITNVTY
jgi:hypothetical protein